MGAFKNRSERLKGVTGNSVSMLTARETVRACKRTSPPCRDMGGPRSATVQLYGEHRRPEIVGPRRSCSRFLKVPG